MIRIIDKLEGGWAIETDEPLKCFNCKEDVNEYDFYYCEQNKKFYCHKCKSEMPFNTNSKIASTMCSPYIDHEDWHIIKVVKDGTES